MDAGKNSRISGYNLGGIPKNTAAQAKSGPKQAPSVQNEPTESVNISGGNAPAIKSEGDSVSTGQTEIRAESAPKTIGVSSGIPSIVGGALIAGPSSISGSSSTKKSFSSLNLHGLNATSLSGVGGDTVLASVNPLKPAAGTRMPTTSVGLLNGIEDTQWITTSGRVIG